MAGSVWLAGIDPSAKSLFSFDLLKKRRKLPCRLEAAGLRGASSAGRLFPARLPFNLVGLLSSRGGVLGGVGTMGNGEAGGGGMLVPSVMLPKSRSRAGSSKRWLVVLAWAAEGMAKKTCDGYEAGRAMSNDGNAANV